MHPTEPGKPLPPPKPEGLRAGEEAGKSRIILPGTPEASLLPPAGNLADVQLKSACLVCQAEVPASALTDGKCLDCRLGIHLRPLFLRLVELLRKQRRYHGKKITAKGTDEQVGRQLRRINDAIRAMVPNRGKAQDYFQRTLGEAMKLVDPAANLVFTDDPKAELERQEQASKEAVPA